MNLMKEKRLQAINEIRTTGIEPYVRSSLIPNLFTASHLIDLQDDVEQMIQIGLHTNPKGSIHTLEGMLERPD